MITEEQELFNEAARLVKVIEENQIKNKEDFMFFLSIKNRVKFKVEITRKQVFWLRDIRDKQL